MENNKVEDNYNESGDYQTRLKNFINDKIDFLKRFGDSYNKEGTYNDGRISAFEQVLYWMSCEAEKEKKKSEYDSFYDTLKVGYESLLKAFTQVEEIKSNTDKLIDKYIEGEN